jgi:hypothetical protein
MSIDPRYAAVILAILLSANQTRADSLSERRAAKEKGRDDRGGDRLR